MGFARTGLMPRSPRSIRWILKLLTTSAVATALAIEAGAATFNVTKTADTLGTCVPGNCSLREATVAAYLTPGFDTIQVPAGLYQLSRAGGDPSTSGDLDLAGDVEIVGAGAALT